MSCEDFIWQTGDPLVGTGLYAQLHTVWTTGRNWSLLTVHAVRRGRGRRPSLKEGMGNDQVQAALTRRQTTPPPPLSRPTMPEAAAAFLHKAAADVTCPC